MTPRICAIPIAVAVLALTACGTANAADPYDDAWETCVASYSELPHALEVLAEQSGEEVTAETPCENWVDSQGRDGFVAFWGDPDEYMPFVTTQGKLEVLAD